MPNKIIPKKSTIADKVPSSSDLALGEVAINYADQCWYGRAPSGAVVSIGAPAVHSHDELYSLDKTKQLELQNNGSLIVTNTASGAATSRTLTLPSSSGTLGLLGEDTIFSDTAPTAPYAGLKWVNSNNGRVYEWYRWPNTITGGFNEAWVEFTGGGSGGAGAGSSGTVYWGDIQNVPSFEAVATSGNYSDLNGTPSLANVATTGSYGDLSNIPTTFEPKAHTHTIANVTGLQTNLSNRYTKTEVDGLLSGKQASGSYAVTGHTHSGEDITSGTIAKERLPVIPISSPPVILSGQLASITTAQQAAVDLGTIVIANDGQRYLYTGSGAKNNPASYILLSDTNITWSEIYDKPNSFIPSFHIHLITDVTGLSEALIDISNDITALEDAVANGSSNQNAAYNTTMADGVVSTQVGGASPKTAQTWKAMSIVQVLDEILFPTIAPTILTAKRASLSLTGLTGTLEIGVSYARTLTATLNQGQIKNGDGTSGPLLVGAATGYTFTGTGINSTAQTSNSLAINTAIVAGTNQWSVSIGHDAGSGSYYDNKGNNSNIFDSSRLSGTAAASTDVITGVYPYYYLKSPNQLTADEFVAVIQNGGAIAVVASSLGNLVIPYELTEQYIYVAYPTSTPAKTTYQTSLSDLGGITLVFKTVETKTITRKTNYSSTGTVLWETSYRVHVGENKTTNANPYITLS